MKWRATIALLLIIFVMFSQAFWMWSIIFMIWVIPDLISGTTHLWEPVERSKNPILYWSIMTVWIVYSVYLVIGYFAPFLLAY